MKRLVKILGIVFAVQIGLWVAGRIAESNTRQDTDPESEDFALATYVNGKQYTSRTGKLHSGTATTIFGGTEIDLTGADPDPAGATLRLKTRFGGVKVVVPKTWRVEMTGKARSGENDMRVADPATLAEDAPRLSVLADTQFGGVLITT
ncbi:MAG: LiaF-related protein [Acidimicrobiia bacterium]|nr:LiaF-related protein [Acidimicrobiia bacterium]